LTTTILNTTLYRRDCFDAIGTVKGAGNSNALKSYSFADVTPITGNDYYRLKQVDKNGNTQYSTTEVGYGCRGCRYQCP